MYTKLKRLFFKNMRNFIIMNNNGEYFSVDYNGKIDINDTEFLNRFFHLPGEISVMPLRDSLIQSYQSKNNDIIERLINCTNSFNSYIIINVLSSSCPPVIDEMTYTWTRNELLSEMFNCDIYAENNFIIISEAEMNNETYNNDINIFNEFVSDINEIIAATYTDASQYLNKLSLIIDNDTILNLDKSSTLAFQNDYIGTKQNNNWTNIASLSNGDALVKKHLIMMHQNGNDAELYFYPQYKFDYNLNQEFELIC